MRWISFALAVQWTEAKWHKQIETIKRSITSAKFKNDKNKINQMNQDDRKITQFKNTEMREQGSRARLVNEFNKEKRKRRP